MRFGNEKETEEIREKKKANRNVRKKMREDKFEKTHTYD